MNQDYAICKIKGPIKLTYITKITSKKKKKKDYQLERNYFKELDHLILIHEENSESKFMDCKMDAKCCCYRKNLE